MINFINSFLTIQTQLKTFHWQTDSYAKHMAFDRTYSELADLIDNFIEVYQGKYGRIGLTHRSDDIIMIKNITEVDLNDWVDFNIDFLSLTVTETLSEEDTDLLNIRDEMIASFSKLKYLLTLN